MSRFLNRFGGNGVKEFATISDMIDGLPTGEVGKVAWSGDTYVDDGAVVCIKLDDGSLSPHPLVQCEVPAALIGEVFEGWESWDRDDSFLNYGSGRVYLETDGSDNFVIATLPEGFAAPITRMRARLVVNDARLIDDGVNHFVGGVLLPYEASSTYSSPEYHMAGLKRGVNAASFGAQLQQIYLWNSVFDSDVDAFPAEALLEEEELILNIMWNPSPTVTVSAGETSQYGRAYLTKSDGDAARTTCGGSGSATYADPRESAIPDQTVGLALWGNIPAGVRVTLAGLKAYIQAESTDPLAW